MQARILIVAWSAMALSACSSFGVAARIDPPKVATYADAGCRVDENGTVKETKKGDRKRRPINLDCFRFPEQQHETVSRMTRTVIVRNEAGQAKTITRAEIVPQKNEMTAYDAAVQDRVMRNRLAAVLIKHADDECTRTLGDVVGNEAGVNLILNVLTTGLTSAATIVTGEKADSILTGVAALTSGTRGHINADIYRGQVTQALTTAISVERTRLFDAIHGHDQQGVADYTVDAMVRDANDYYQACSFYKGLQFALKATTDYPKLEAAQKRVALEQEIAQLRVALDRNNIDQQKAKADSKTAAALDDQGAALAEELAARQADLGNAMQVGATGRPRTTDTDAPDPAKPEPDESDRQ